MISALIGLLIVAMILGLVWYAVTAIVPVPQPFRNIVLVVLVIIMILYLLQFIPGAPYAHPLV